MTDLKITDLRSFLGEGVHTGQQCGIWPIGGNAEYLAVESQRLRIKGSVRETVVDMELILTSPTQCQVIRHGVGRDDNATYVVDPKGVGSLYIKCKIPFTDIPPITINSIRFWRHRRVETTYKINESVALQANVHPK